MGEGMGSVGCQTHVGDEKKLHFTYRFSCERVRKKRGRGQDGEC